ncbi:MAG: Fic family protein [Ferruginibacter sp.]
MTEEQEIKVLAEILSVYPEGAGIEEIKGKMGLEMGTRTLQRRLVKLEQRGLITTSGNKRTRLYHLVGAPANTTAPERQEAKTNGLEGHAEDVFRLVSQSLEKRSRVGYNRDFLDQYIPNKHAYLDDNDRPILLVMGTTELPDQPAGTYARQILHRLLIDLSWNSSRLEGNTYSLLDTQRLIAEGDAAENRSAIETQMILNHKEAIEFLVQDSPDIGINRYTLLNLHALLSNNLLPDPSASGRLRTFGVGINQSTYTPLAIPQVIEELFDTIIEKAAAINDPFEQAFFLMVHIPYLQPFDDVNKRVSRLAANIPLNHHNLAPLSFTDVSADLYIKGLLGVYELNRIELLKHVFIEAYEKSAAKYAKLRQTIGEPDPFRIQYRNQLRRLISTILISNLTRTAATDTIDEAAETVPEADRSKFIETAQNELLALHEGNFARYQVTPSQFKRWKDLWG